uniref:RNA helicase n=1 Tax=Lotharella globosa TaxID=91324 RepID=A0A7S3Z7Q7_9EUKA
MPAPSRRPTSRRRGRIIALWGSLFVLACYRLRPGSESLADGAPRKAGSLGYLQRLRGGAEKAVEGLEQLTLETRDMSPPETPTMPAMSGSTPVNAPVIREAKKEGKKKVPRIETFEKMELKDELLRGIYDYGFVKPSIIQQKAILPVAKGSDIIAQSQSGTGKTGAFVIATLQRVDAKRRGVTQALILSPTQHLAQQTQKVMRCIGQYMDIRVHLSAGGANVREDMEALRSGVEVVVGTPGRIIDMLKKGCMQPKDMKLIVLDEADEMLSTGFRDDMYQVFQFLPQDVQVALFSATVPEELKDVISELLRDPVQIRVKKETLTLTGIRQYYVPLRTDSDKLDTLCDLHDQLGAGSQTIIFCKSRRGVDALTDALTKGGYACSSVHGEMPPADRKRIIDKFRKGKTRVLISSDLLARGIDVQTVTTVLNYDLPRDMENYLHRVGRCGRFGRRGVAINFVTERDFNLMEAIESFYNVKFDKLPVDINIQAVLMDKGSVNTRPDPDAAAA